MTTIIRTLRDTVPLRPLTVAEALRVAELQANRFIEMLELAAPPVPEKAIASLPRIEVKRMTPSFAAGASQWTRGRWLIVLAGSEPRTRQRFSLAHEFKHIVDSPFVKVIYPAGKQWRSQEQVEQVCEYFAACLLMPRKWVKRAFCDEGVQDLVRLARRFEVSPMAMEVRLLHLGLVTPRPRCALGVER
jgi:Zn-dependent peptidase ImmA (M78 family)